MEKNNNTITPENGAPAGPWRKIRSFFSRARKVEAVVVNSDEDIQKQLEGHLRKLHDDFTLNLKDERLVDVVNGHILSVSLGIFGSQGTQQGKLGAKNHQVGTAAISHATQITEHIVSKTSGKIKGYDTEIRSKQKDEKWLEDDFLTQKKKYDKFLDYSQEEHRHFSVSMLWVYLISAILLMVADLAVSLSVVSFFNVGSTGGDADFFDKLADPELILFALGICLCTLLVKVIWDEYINTKLGAGVVAFSKLKDDHEKQLYKIRIEYYVKLIVKLIVLAGLFFMLFNLSIFRNAHSGIGLQEEAMKVEPGLAKATFWSFVGITVIFPIISGVCLSLALSIRSNRANLKKMNKQKEEYHKELKLLRKDIETVIMRKEELEFFLKEWSNSAHKITIISNQFISSYEQAYKTAFLQLTGKDTFKLVQQLQHESLYESLVKAPPYQN